MINLVLRLREDGNIDAIIGGAETIISREDLPKLYHWIGQIMFYRRAGNVGPARKIDLGKGVERSDSGGV